MKLTLRTEVQRTLFVREIRGQLSDGHWENSPPREHYIPWLDCEVEVGPDAGRDFNARKDNYNLLASELLDVVGPRMIRYARIASALEGSVYLASVLDEVCRTVVAQVPAAVEWPAEVVEQVEACMEDEGLYSMADLKRDLREMKKAMRTQHA